MDSTGPDNTNWKAVMDKYGNKSDPRDTFSQAGYLSAKASDRGAARPSRAPIAPQDEPYDAFWAGVKNWRSDNDAACGFGPADRHQPNHADDAAEGRPPVSRPSPSATSPVTANRRTCWSSRQEPVDGHNHRTTSPRATAETPPPRPNPLMGHSAALPGRRYQRRRDLRPVGVGLVVLHRASGVVNFAYGALGGLGGDGLLADHRPRQTRSGWDGRPGSRARPCCRPTAALSRRRSRTRTASPSAPWRRSGFALMITGLAQWYKATPAPTVWGLPPASSSTAGA